MAFTVLALAPASEDTCMALEAAGANPEATNLLIATHPLGVILSQTLATAEGEMRLNLNGAGERRTFAGALWTNQFGAGVQHIALFTDDIFEASKHLSDAGFPRLRMPDYCYEDLAATFALDANRIERLGAKHVLYDREDHAETCQIYSTPIYRGFFFEFIQRRSGYQG